ncbi:cytochrome c oxidase subunit II [bacterium]|nr:cytochrome c oxidase subunit II [bacterium]
MKRYLPLLGAFILGATSLGADAPMDWTKAEGPVAASEWGVFLTTLWVDVGILIIVGGLLTYAIFKFRAKEGDDTPPKQVHGNIKLEVGIMVVSALLLVVIEIPNVKAIWYTASPPEGREVMDINIIGHQWWWEVEYPSLGIKTANEIMIPVGKVVNFHLASADVIHSFWVPRLGGKLDLIPGKVNQLWLEADKPGEYYGQCAELCGVSHANMRLRVFAQTDEDFEIWVSSQLEGAALPESDSAEEGEALFLSKGCIACHTARDIPGALGIIGPDLTHVGSRGMIASGVLPNTDEAMASWIQDPEAIKPGNIMSRDGPMYNGTLEELTPSEVEALVAFLRGLK